MNLRNAVSEIGAYFSPRIIGDVNDHYIKVVRVKGDDVPWHHHQNEDELFFVIEGELLIELENQPALRLREGDLYVVRKGVNHRVSAQQECSIMLIEPKSTEHTGDIKADITKSIAEQKY